MVFGISNQLLGGAIFTLVGGVALVTEFLELAHAIDSTDWPALDGEVEETGVVSDLSSRSTTYAPVVRYHYRVGDRQYLSDRIAFGGVVSSSFRFLAAKVAERYGRRKTVKVYVSPKDAALCVLEPGVHWVCWFVIALGAVFLGLGLQALLAYFGILPGALLEFKQAAA